MKKLKPKENKKAKEKELYDEEIPEKDADCIDIIPKKSIQKSSSKTLTIKTNALS